jgi:hypothetical protein
MNLERFALNAMKLARVTGFPGHSVSFKVAGLTVAQLPVNRQCTVSINAPQLYDGTTTQIWVDSDLNVFKSSNWYKPAAPIWEQITTYEELFIEGSASSYKPSVDSLPLAGGTMGGPVLLFRDPILSNEAATRSYVDSVVELIAAGKLYIEHPVTTVAELRALDVSTIPDEQVIFVEATRKMYAYDLQGIGIDDGQYIIVPSSGIGRWISTTPNVIDGGVLP